MKLQTYLTIGLKTYKIKRQRNGQYSVYKCADIATLQYLGDWTKQQLIQSVNRGELI
jgi:hypothetical protein